MKSVKDPVTLTAQISDFTGDGFYSMRKPLDDIAIHLTRPVDVKGRLFRFLGLSPGKIGKNDIADLIAKAYVITPNYVSLLVHREKIR